MAVIRMDQPGKIVLSVETGIGGTGNPTYGSRTFPKVKIGTTDSNAYAIAEALGELQKYPVVIVSRYECSYLLSDD